VEQNKTQIKIIENNISILSEKKGRVDFSRMVKQPTVSIAPVNNIFFNMVLAGLLTLFVFVFLSIILYSFQSQKSHLS
jgi:heme/copper-type cytochrome/quinol oxidase subunit 2